MTPSAISQRIHALEAHLGSPLGGCRFISDAQPCSRRNCSTSSRAIKTSTYGLSSQPTAIPSRPGFSPLQRPFLSASAYCSTWSSMIRTLRTRYSKVVRSSLASAHVRKFMQSHFGLRADAYPTHYLSLPVQSPRMQALSQRSVETARRRLLLEGGALPAALFQPLRDRQQ
ncbi:hypothetical protein [Pseudomonas sp. NFX224]|uniref:hypothetical protein n=1 Tax=Pseudomonas sp. NFX224 TaxID=3402862 RepID=UPI003AFB4225